MFCDHDRHQPMLRSTSLPQRRGASTMTGLLMTLGLLGTLTVAAFVVHPMATQARGQALPAVQPATHARHQQIIESLAQLVARSYELVAVHQRGVGPYVELVLRATGEESDRVRPEEILLLSHSEILQTITLYHLNETIAGSPGASAIKPPFSSLSYPALRAATFPPTWRSDPAVVSRVLATGISDMQARLIPDNGSRSHLWIELTWDGETADVTDQASVLVELNATGRRQLE